MLLPSALPCDSAQLGMVSPPASPPTLSSPATFSIVSSSFSLQNLVANTAATDNHNHYNHNYTYSYNQYYNHHNYDQQNATDMLSLGGGLPQPLPTPPMAHAPSPMRLRLRARGEQPRGIVKRSADNVPRHHRRTLSSSQTTSPTTATTERDSRDASPERPTTPKRSRIAPERMPLGLERSDFHSLHSAAIGGSDAGMAATEEDSNEWTPEDDRMLVELVLEKLKLSKSDWQDCARNLGKDRHSLSRRWKSLMMSDEVGLKRRKIHSTWR